MSTSTLVTTSMPQCRNNGWVLDDICCGGVVEVGNIPTPTSKPQYDGDQLE